MNRRVAVVLGLTFAALVGATLWVPAVLGSGWMPRGESGEWRHHDGHPASPTDIEYVWAWDDSLRSFSFGVGPAYPPIEEIYWPLLVAEWVAILFLGGGAIAFLRLRERRRRAAA